MADTLHTLAKDLVKATRIDNRADSEKAIREINERGTKGGLRFSVNAIANYAMQNIEKLKSEIDKESK